MRTLKQIAVGWVFVFAAWAFTGIHGLFPDAFSQNAGWRWLAYVFVMAHLTITCMSICFHRFHTHRGVELHPLVDKGMQLWLWLVTSMSKLDWVSIHVFHHSTSDTPEDPHSPVHKGFWHVFIKGAYDYTLAKQHPEALRIRKRLPATPMEKWIDSELMLGPIILTGVNLCLFGWFWGAILSITNFLISPVFAVGGVNTIAHTFGYRNYETRDNSRNIGLMLAPLNFIICGELDHNNHHAKPRSCSFRHRWYEFDIGYVYIRAMSAVGLARILEAYSPARARLATAGALTREAT